MIVINFCYPDFYGTCSGKISEHLTDVKRILIDSRKGMQSHPSVAHPTGAQATMNAQHHMRNV